MQGHVAEAIRQVVYDPALRERLIERGFQRVKQFDWEESARNVMRVYEGLVGREDRKNEEAEGVCQILC